MARQDVRIELPVANPGKTLDLLSKAIARNTALGINSPVKDDFNWADLATALTAMQALLTEITQADQLAQSQHYEALRLIGTAPGQNLQSHKTLYPLVTDVRDILLVKNQTNPEALELWGFTVVVTTTGAKRNVDVTIPTDSPAEFLTLCNAIISQHTALGVASPLNGKVDMDFFADTTATAQTNFTNAEENRGIKEAQHGNLMNQLGYAEGQTSETTGTVYNIITNIRDLLLVVYSSNPEELTRWGFAVVVGQTAMGGSNEPAPTPPPAP